MSESENPLQPLDYASPEQNKRRSTSLLAWILLSLLLLFFIASILLPSPVRSRETANRVLCASNLRQIGQAILLYTNDHHGQYPDSLETVLTNEEITSEVFVCPSSNDTLATGPTTQAIAANLVAPGHLSYIYLARGWATATTPPTAIVAYEPLTNHAGAGMNALFADGHVEFLTPPRAKSLLNTTPATMPTQP